MWVIIPIGGITAGVIINAGTIIVPIGAITDTVDTGATTIRAATTA